MTFCDLHWNSDILGKQVGTYVLLPDKGDGPFPVFYLLHGLGDDHTIWLRRTRIESYAQRYPMIIVMPDGFRGFYTNNARRPAYAQFIGEELPAMIQRTFPALAGGGKRCIGGLSMGGYGALRVGLEYADRYVSINSHSGALHGPAPDRLKPGEYEEIFGSGYEGSDHDLLKLALAAQKRGPLPAIRIDVGNNDFLFEDNRYLHNEFTRHGIAHEYAECPGTHNWDYWDEHVREALAFHAKAAGIDGF